jgi:hypothetical protein
VLKPGGLIGASSIEYGGLTLHDPNEPIVRRFYRLRLQIAGACGPPSDPIKTIHTWRYKGIGSPAVPLGRYLRFGFHPLPDADGFIRQVHGSH